MKKKGKFITIILMKMIAAVVAVTFVGSIAAEVVDLWQEREKNKKARSKKIHISYGIYERYFKRFLDFFLSSLALVGFSPVLLATAVLVRVKLGSPVLFTQERPGKDEKIFRLYKFRSMTDETDDEGELLPDEERLTGFGRMLRSTSLDELPELVNILKGDMSVVGPRPLVPRYLPYYTEQERHRHDVRPGLTGLAQVNGRNHLSWEERFEFDIQYVSQISFINDLTILFQTVQKVVHKDDVIVRGTKGSVLDFDVERKMRDTDIKCCFR